MTSFSFGFGVGTPAFPMNDAGAQGLILSVADPIAASLQAPVDVDFGTGGTWLLDGAPAPANLEFRTRAVLAANGALVAGPTNGLILPLPMSAGGQTLRLELAARLPGDPWGAFFIVATRAIAGGGITQTITHNTLDFTVTDVLSQGVHDDGSPWIEIGPAAQLTGTSTPSAQITHTHATSSSDATPINTIAWAHGLMRNPGRSDSGSTLAQKQAANDFAIGQDEGAQGWSELQLKSNYTDYDHTQNLDPGATGTALTLTPGVYVKARTFTDMADLDWDGRPTVETFGVLTVYAQGDAPAAGSLRPPFAGAGATPTGWTAADLDMSIFQNLPAAGLANQPPAAATILGLLTQVQTWHATYNTNTENVVPMWPGSDFNGDFAVSSYFGTTVEALAVAMVALNYDAWSASQKRAIAAKLAQIGIDLAERSYEGGIWYPNGGHSTGKKFLVALAAELLDSAYLRAACALEDQGTALFREQRAGDSIWGEDHTFKYLDQANIDASATNDYGSADDTRSLAWPQSMLGWPEWVGSAKSEGVDVGWGNTLGNTNAAPRQYLGQVGQHLAPMCLAARLTQGVQATMGPVSQVMFDWCDRYVQYRLGDGAMVALSGVDTPPDANDICPFAYAAWTQDRGTSELWVPGVSQPLGVDEPAFDGWVYDMGGASSGTIRWTGTSAFNDDVQVRLVRDDLSGALAWQSANVAQNGTWSVDLPIANDAEMAHWYHVEVRIGTDNGTAISTAGLIGIGDAVGIFGQSELAYFLIDGTFHSGASLPRTLNAENVSVIHREETGNGATTDPGAIQTYRITAATQTRINSGSAALANAWHLIRPGRKLMIVDLAHPGTSPTSLADDSEPDRDWAAFTEVLDIVNDKGSALGCIVMNWYNSTASMIATMHDHMAPFLFGQTSDGNTFTLGTAHTEPFWSRVIDHCLYDLDVAPGNLGRGVLDRGRTPMVLMQPMPFNDSDDTEDSSFDESQRVTNDERAGVLAFAASAQFAQVGTLGPSTHIANFDGGIHPLTDNAYGVPLFAMQHLPGLLLGTGEIVGEPQITDAVAVAANTIEVTVDLPNGGDLTTIRALQSLADPAAPPPHFQDVVGFQIDRTGDVKRPVYDTGETSYPSQFRGTVTITDAGTGTAPNRTGTVTLTLTDPVVTGDLVTYLDGQATAILAESRDRVAELFLNMLIEHVPAWYDATAPFPYHGVAVRPQTPTASLTATGGTGGSGPTWSITAGDGQATIDSHPTQPNAPIVTAGDGQALLETS